MQLTILGNNSALPNHNRFPTAQILQVGKELILLDCGEGTQIRLQNNQIKYGKISKIFISHLHGDHYFGLIGLLTRYALNNRSEPLDLFGPPPLIDIIKLQTSVANATFPYELRFHPVEEVHQEKLILDQENLKVTAFPTEHRIPCYGYKFESIIQEKKLQIEKVQDLQIPIHLYKEILNGADFVDLAGNTIAHETLVQENTQKKVYAYAADTRYTESFLEVIQDSDLLYHETTYLKDHQNLAAQRFHSTTIDAATIAKKANVGRLVIGHFSSKYRNLSDFLEETKTIFSETLLSFEGMKIDV